jgi:uncharacterized lipoprotein YbaY/heat shock protein HslJ
MFFPRTPYQLLLTVLLLAAVSSAQTVTGTAIYLERIALPANAVFEAVLEEVSRADAAATILDSARQENPGQPPFKFAMQYDPAKIVAGRSYSVRARVTVDGKLMFSSDRSYPVLTQGKGKEVVIIMRRASEPASALAEKNGMFRYLADAPSFTDCQTRERVPVAREGSYKALEAAYLQMQKQPGEELIITLEGQITARPNAEGERPLSTLVVTRYFGIWPGETCGAAGATSPLRETYWKLTRLQGKPVIVAQNLREPNLVFHTKDNRLTGSGGCNDLTSAYKLTVNEITFNGIAATRKACLEGMDTEGEFLAVLENVRSWKILGEHLELYDAGGALLARLEARALK